MSDQFVKSVNETIDFPEVIRKFYQRTNKGTWTKNPELFKSCQGYTENLQRIKIGKYSNINQRDEQSCVR